MAEKIYKIEVLVEQIEWEGKTFPAYKVINKKGKKETIKFTKTSNNGIIAGNGYIYVNANDINEDNSGKYPVIWCKKVLKYEAPTPRTSNLDDEFELADELGF